MDGEFAEFVLTPDEPLAQVGAAAGVQAALERVAGGAVVGQVETGDTLAQVRFGLGRPQLGRAGRVGARLGVQFQFLEGVRSVHQTVGVVAVQLQSPRVQLVATSKEPHSLTRSLKLTQTSTFNSAVRF